MNREIKQYASFVLALLIVGCIMVSCNKSYTGLDPLSTQITHLTGSNGAYSMWRLQSLYINRQLQPVGSVRSGYYKTYQLNGNYQDADGLKGNWSLVAKDSLREVITNTNSGIKAVQGYRITNLTATELALTYKTSSGDILLNFLAEK